MVWVNNVNTFYKYRFLAHVEISQINQWIWVLLIYNWQSIEICNHPSSLSKAVSFYCSIWMFVLFSVSQLTPSYPPVYFHLCVWQFTAESLIKKKTTKPLYFDSIETSCLYTVQELQVAAITACFICTTFMARPLINLNIFVNERMHNWWKQSFLIAAGLWNHLLEVIAIEGSRCIREISFHVTPVERGCLTNMLHAGLIIFYF